MLIVPTMSTIFVRTQLFDRLNAARAMSDALFAMVKPECLVERPIGERHRIIFYIGHLEAFDWNLVRATIADIKPFNADFDKLFAFGIDPVDGGLPHDVPSDWPSLERIQEYRERVRATLKRAVVDVTAGPKRDQIMNVMIEHRLMHVETLTYMFHWLDFDRKIERPQDDEPTAPAATNEMVEVAAGVATLGLPRGGKFGWDNEFNQHEVDVPAFAIDKYKITNAQYLEFVRDGGRHPKFWIERNGEWLFRGMFREYRLPADWPVYVSHEEASAYASWAGKTLPTEAQWHRAAAGSSTTAGNFNFKRWDPVSVAAYAEGAGASGAVGMTGNGWEWTSTTFAPFDGFEPFPFYPGYSADFFDGKHFVMKGGSARTAACMLRPSFRNWFQAHYPHIYAGFRCVSK